MGSQDASRSPKSLPGGQQYLQNRSREGSGGCSEAAFVEKRRNLTKHYYLLYTSHIRAPQTTISSKHFRVRNGAKKRPPRKLRQSDANSANKMSRKRPRSSRR